MSDQPLQIWVRNEKGKVYGPLTAVSAELLVDNGIITGKLQISTDGNNYVYPGRMPGVRMVFPKELWGDVVVPDNGSDAGFTQSGPLPTMGGDPSSAGPTAPVAAAPVAGPGIPRGVVAGPAFRGPVQRPPVPPGQRPTVQNRAQGAVNMRVGVAGAFNPHAPPGPQSSPSAVAQPGSPVVAGVPPVVSSGSGIQSAPHRPVPIAALVTALPPSGNLSDLTPLRLYFLAASSDSTGLLSLHLADRTLLVHFRKGNPEFIDSTHEEDSLQAFLLKQSLATVAQIAQADAEKARFGGELVPALFGLGLMNPSSAFTQLAQRATTLLGQALLAEAGTFTWEAKELPAQKAMPLGNRWSAFVEQVRKVSGPDARRRLHQALDLPVMKSGGPLPVSDLRLTPQETRAYGRFDGVASVHQLAAAHQGEADTLYRTAWMLKDCDLVAFSSAALPPPPEDPEPGPAPVVAARVQPADAPTPLHSPPVSHDAPTPLHGVSLSEMPTPTPFEPPAAAPARPPPVMAPPPAGSPAAAPRPPPVMSPPVMSPPAGGPAAAPRPPPVMAPPPPGAPVRAAANVAPVRAAPVISPSTPLHGVAATAASPAAPGVSDADTRALVELAEKWKTLNHFEVLGLAKEAPAETVKPAYLKLARHYHPDMTPQGAPEAYAKARADVFARITEANRVLSDPKSRAEYVAELAAGGTGEKVDISAILAAEEFFQKGCILVKARKFPEAVKMLDDAIKASPDEGEYYAWRGYARFFLEADKKVGHAEAMKDLAVCGRKNPNVAAQYYFLGNMAKLMGDLKNAKTHFQKCVQLDPKHIDAQRELRMMK